MSWAEELDKRLSEIEGRLTAITSDLGDLERQQNRLRERFTGLLDVLAKRGLVKLVKR